MPDLSHAGDPLPDGVLAWNSLMQTTNAAADQDSVRFDFSFTNVATHGFVCHEYHVIVDSVAKTNITAVTNFTPSASPSGRSRLLRLHPAGIAAAAVDRFRPAATANSASR